jgi:hypothetical protein
MKLTSTARPTRGLAWCLTFGFLEYAVDGQGSATSILLTAANQADVLHEARPFHARNANASLHVASLDRASDETQHLIGNPAHVACGIWLAPSTIPGAGLGMYAGHDFAKGESLQKNHLGEPVGDPVIPIIDIELHNGNREVAMLWDQYTWRYVPVSHEGNREGFVVWATELSFLFPILVLALSASTKRASVK